MEGRHSKFWKIFLSILGTIIGGITIIFIGFFIYYSWQFKFGNTEEIKQLTEEFEDKFSIISEESAPTLVENQDEYIRSHNPIQGAIEPQITIISFIDFECPYCQEQYPILKRVIEKYNPVVRLVFKQLPLTAIHPHSYNAAIASTCAQEQDKFWEYHDNLFENIVLDDSGLRTAAQNIGLNTELFDKCFNGQIYRKYIIQDNEDAITIGVRGTPTHLINNEIIEGVPTLEEWDTLILKYLKK